MKTYLPANQLAAKLNRDKPLFLLIPKNPIFGDTGKPRRSRIEQQLLVLGVNKAENEHQLVVLRVYKEGIGSGDGDRGCSKKVRVG